MWRGNVEVERETGGGERHHTETDRVVNLHWTRTPCTLSGTTKQTDAAQSQHEHSRINRAKKPKNRPAAASAATVYREVRLDGRRAVIEDAFA